MNEVAQLRCQVVDDVLLPFNGVSCYPKIAQVEELMEHMPGPDFPTGGQILGTDGYI